MSRLIRHGQRFGTSSPHAVCCPAAAFIWHSLWQTYTHTLTHAYTLSHAHTHTPACTLSLSPLVTHVPLQVDLVCLGSRGMGSFKRSLMGFVGLGSVSDYCLHNLACAVAVIKAEADKLPAPAASGAAQSAAAAAAEVTAAAEAAEAGKAEAAVKED